MVEESLYFIKLQIKNIPEPAFYINKSLIFVDCNHPFSQLINKPRNSLIGKSLDEALEPEVSPVFTKACKYFLMHKETKSYKQKLRLHNLDQHELIFYKPGFVNPDPETDGLVCIIIDITDHKKLHREIIRKLLNNHQVKDQKKPGVIILTTGVNDQFIIKEICINQNEVKNYIDKKITGKPLKKVFPEFYQTHIPEILNQVYNSGKGYVGVFHQESSKDKFWEGENIIFQMLNGEMVITFSDFPFIENIINQI